MMGLADVQPILQFDNLGGGADHDARGCASARSLVQNVSVPALQHSKWSNEADAARRRLHFRIEVRLWVHTLFVPGLAAPLFRTCVCRPAAARRRGRVSPAKG